MNPASLAPIRLTLVPLFLQDGLACAVVGDPSKARAIASKIRAGIKWINCSQPTLLEAPWGGLKKSGFGKDLGVDGLAGYLAKAQICEMVGAEPFKWY